MLSSEPKEISDLVKFKNFIKNLSYGSNKEFDWKNKINLITGDGIKKYSLMNILLLIHKRKVCTQKKYQKNETFKKTNISIKGPAGGLLPKYFSIIINKKAKTKILKDEPITWDML